MIEVLNDRFWVSRGFKDKNPAGLLPKFIHQIATGFGDSGTNLLDYTGYAKSSSRKQINDFLPALAAFDPSSGIKTDNGKLAFWLNVYNILVIDIVSRFSGENSMRDVEGFFTDYGYKIADAEFSLDIIEHGILRSNKAKYRSFTGLLSRRDSRLDQKLELDPRLHFALHVASISSPKLKAFAEADLDSDLDRASTEYLSQQVVFDDVKNQVYLPKIFDWYSKDFGGKSDARKFAMTQLGHSFDESKLAAVLSAKVRYLEYDWNLNHSLFKG